MKTTLKAGLIALVIGNAFASTVDTESVRFDGSARELSMQLKAEETRTEYRSETVARTCYRTVMAGHRRVCRRPTPTQPGQCWSEPIYRTVPYTCYETVRVPYQVFENYVDANVAINFGEVPAGFTPNENITATLSGDRLTLTSVGTKTLVLEVSNLIENRRMVGNTEMLDVVAAVKFHDAAAVKRALKLTDASIQKSVMSYNLGPIAGVQLAHSLKIVDDPLIGSSTTLFDAELGDVLSREERGNTTAMKIAFRDVLGRDLGAGRYNVTAKAAFKAGVSVMNASELGELSVEKTILYKIR
jgi:hypothetical protein